MTRTPGRYGRRPPKNHPAIALTRLLTGIVPAHPAAADNFTALSGSWKMLGNDQYGDCVAVTWANVRRLVTSWLAAVETYPPLSQVETLYKTQNPRFPADDNGMDIQTCLEYLVSHGGPDGVKALGFAKVDHTRPDEVKAAIALFGSVWTGINVLDANMTEFSAGQPWNYVSGSPLDGGHSVVTGGYGTPGAGPLGGDERFITWAEETSFTDAFWSRQVEEAWVVIWPEHLGSKEFLAGVSMDQFAADYQQITGKPFPSVVPPAPAPVPVPSDPDAAFAAVLRGDDRAGHPWIDEHHVGYNHKVQVAAQAWLASKGL